uniref:Uncharacterized protein n=1 Tax=Onchocerca volvulus TaxID=6282 RepID=A0A8R1TRX5_ONCVO
MTQKHSIISSITSFRRNDKHHGNMLVGVLSAIRIDDFIDETAAPRRTKDTYRSAPMFIRNASQAEMIPARIQ